MLNILHSQFEYNIGRYYINAYIICIKKALLIFSWAPQKISISSIKYCEYRKHFLQILNYFKKLETLKTAKAIGDKYNKEMTGE